MNHSLQKPHVCLCFSPQIFSIVESIVVGGWWVGSHVREIGDMDEGIVEGGEDASDAEDEFAWRVPAC